MQDLKPSSNVTNDIDRGEVHFSINGLWGSEEMEGFIEDLNKSAWPLVKAGKTLHVLGSMEGFVAQTRETGNIIQDHLVTSRDYGLTRVAICGASALVKLQYKRLSDGLDVEFFDSKLDALRWLRRPYENAA